MTKSRVAICTPRYLPREKWRDAAEIAARHNPKNLPGGARPGDLAGGGDRIAVDINKYWGKEGVKLTVGFLDNPPADLRARILSHMNAWSHTANVSFVESSTDPRVRIARMTAEEAPPGMNGYWSYLGTDIDTIPKDQPTMNLEAFTMETLDSEFYRVVRHETGHTLGFPHEHMRRQLIERLDRDKVIAEFERTQGWSEQMVIDQVLTPLEESSLLGTPDADARSIMCYQISGDLTLDGEPIEGGVDIDDSDYEFVAHLYPKT
jgi:hypothetical protein